MSQYILDTITTTGTNTYVGKLKTKYSSVQEGTYIVKIDSTNTTASTLTIDGNSYPIVAIDGSALTGDELTVGTYIFVFDSTNFVVMSHAKSGQNFANADLKFSANRTHDFNGKILTYNDSTIPGNTLTLTLDDSGNGLLMDVTDATGALFNFAINTGQFTYSVDDGLGRTGVFEVNNGYSSLQVAETSGSLSGSGGWIAAGRKIQFIGEPTFKSIEGVDDDILDANLRWYPYVVSGELRGRYRNASATISDLIIKPTSSASGDLSGSYPNPTVAKINGVVLGTTTATSGNLLIGSGTQWVSVGVSGDITINSSGVTAIGSSKVTNSMLAGSIAASKLVGTDITTVGTITTGTWQGSAIADSYISSASTWNAKVDRSGDTMTGYLTLSGDPINGLHAASKQYVDNLITGLAWKPAVHAATTTNITLSGVQTIDGHLLIVGERVLVKNQTTQTDNGIYVVSNGTWQRANDADTGVELLGSTVYVQQGTLNGGTQWSNNNTSITLGSTNVTFIQIAGSGTYTNGTGLLLTGNVFSIDSTVTTLTGSQTLTNKTLTSPVINVGSDATGDIYYRNAGVYTRLGIGSTNQVLSVVGGLPAWAAISAPNLGSDNLTSTDDARTFTLKSGGTASQNLQFLNSGGGNLLKLSGNSTIDFGSSANYINSNFYCNPATNTNFNVLRGTDVYIQSDVAAYNTYFRGSSWSQYIVLAHNAGQIQAVGASAGFTTNNLVLRNDSAVNSFFSMNAAGTQTVRFDSPSNNFLMKDTRIGGVYTDSFLSKFGVKGNGSTSATTTALFQNSSAVTSLELKDDLSVNIGTSGTGSTTNFYLPTGNAGMNIYSLSGVKMLAVSSNSRRFNFLTPNQSTALEVNVNTDVSPFMRVQNDGWQLIYKPSSGAYEAMNLSMAGAYPYLNMRDAVNSSTVNIVGGNSSNFLYSMTIGSMAATNASCLLELVSTTKGFGLPSMTTTQKNSIASPRAGLMVYDSTLTNLSFHNGTAWTSLGTGDALTTGTLAQFAATSSAQLAGVISDETGSGSLVFGTGATMSNLTLDRISLSGNISTTAWTTNGIGIKHTTRTITDTSSSGTVAAAYTNVLGGNTIAASAATTYTDYATLYLANPSAGTNVTMTNTWSLITQGGVKIGTYAYIPSIKGSIVTDSDGATITFDKNAGDTHQVTLAGNRTLALSNMAPGDKIVLHIGQDATGSRTVTWFSTIKWAGGTVPTLTTTANKVDSFGFQCISAGNYYGYVIGQNI